MHTMIGTFTNTNSCTHFCVTGENISVYEGNSCIKLNDNSAVHSVTCNNVKSEEGRCPKLIAGRRQICKGDKLRDQSINNSARPSFTLDRRPGTELY